MNVLMINIKSFTNFWRLLAAILLLMAFDVAATLSAPSPTVVGHKPVLHPSYAGRLLVGDSITFLPGYQDKDHDPQSSEMEYEFYISSSEGEMLTPLYQGENPSLHLGPQMNGQYLAVKTQAISTTGDPLLGEPITYVFPHRVGHLLGVTDVGKGLTIGSEGQQCILDGQWTINYSPTCVVYKLDTANFDWTPYETYFEVSYNAAFAATEFIFHGYWRQSKAGSLGIWAVYGCTDIACSQPKQITANKLLAFSSETNTSNAIIKVTDVQAYYRYRFVYIGGATDANGGKGSGSFNEIQIR